MEPPLTEPAAVKSPVGASTPLLSPRQRPASFKKSCLERVGSHHMWLKSRAIVLILLWNVIVGLIYGSLQCAVIASTLGLKSPIKMFRIITGGYAGIALVQIFLFPVGGLVADIWQGRYRIVHLSFVKIFLGFIFLVPLGLLEKCERAQLCLAIITVVLLSLGFAGFQSNAVQFGLDQLSDAPSEKLSLFLHWFVWTQSVGEIVAIMLGAYTVCNNKVKQGLLYVPIPLAITSMLLLLISCCKHRWYHCEPKSTNPYGTVLRVLQFAATHKYPPRRSARTYCGDMSPTRLDHANTLYGGPFPVEVVEDVKTFLRMLVMLLLICPVFFLEMSTSTLRPLYGLYVGHHDSNKHCRTEWLIFQSGIFSRLVTVLAVPLYIVALFPRATRLVPRILHRMLIGIVLLVSAVAVMVILYASAIQKSSHSKDKTCLFFTNIHDLNMTETLHLNSLYLVIPGILTGVARPIIHISTLEFTSAQSPYPMKGLLLGTFYATRGMYNLIGCLTVYIFTIDELQFRNKYLDCGFIYYCLNIFVGLLCLPVVVKAIRWYQYRQREETPYDHRYVEYYYSRYISQYSGSVEGKNRELPCSYESLNHTRKK